MNQFGNGERDPSLRSRNELPWQWWWSHSVNPIVFARWWKKQPSEGGPICSSFAYLVMSALLILSYPRHGKLVFLLITFWTLDFASNVLKVIDYIIHLICCKNVDVLLIMMLLDLRNSIHPSSKFYCPLTNSLLPSNMLLDPRKYARSIF